MTLRARFFLRSLWAVGAAGAVAAATAQGMPPAPVPSTVQTPANARAMRASAIGRGRSARSNQASSTDHTGIR